MRNLIQDSVSDTASFLVIHPRTAKSKVTLARLLGATALAAFAIRLFELTSNYDSWVLWCLVFAIGGAAIGVSTHGLRGFMGGLGMGAAVAVSFLLFW